MKKNETIKAYLDKTKPLAERKAIYLATKEKMMNPFKNFDPKNFEPIKPDEDLEPEIYARERKKHTGKFPTFGIEPKVIREGQMIGMFESKQDLYLMFAHRVNDLMDEIDLLKKEINTLKNNAKNL
jgi:hypothetical protein